MVLFPFPPLRLLVATGYLSLKAQSVTRRSILQVWDTLRTTQRPTRRFDPDQVLRSVLLVSAIARRLGFDGSCLVRALVSGRLLLGRDELQLKIGMHTRHDSPASPAGHAWVELSGRNLSDPTNEKPPATGFRVTHTIQLTRENE